MVRPVKRRRVCKLPAHDTFGPDSQEVCQGSNSLSVEAYETIRLIDYIGLTQEEAAIAMGVARSTIQRMYDDARQIIADSIVNSKMLKIEGGHYVLCADKAKEEEGCSSDKPCPKATSGKRCCEI